MMMKLINDQPYVNLEPYLDMESFDMLHDDVIRALAKNSENIETSYTTHNTLFDQSRPGYFEELTRNKERYPDLNKKELQMYTKLSGAVTLGSHLMVRSHSNYPTSYFYKHLKKDAVNFPWYDDFEFLFKWLEDQKCFSEFGRVLFWINEPGQTSAIHSDYGNQNFNRKDMFIWLTGKFPKRMVLHDKENNQSFVVPNRAIVFNSLNWHSSIGHENLASWSLRIDGVFDSDWAEKAGIKDYYNL